MAEAAALAPSMGLDIRVFRGLVNELFADAKAPDRELAPELRARLDEILESRSKDELLDYLDALLIDPLLTSDHVKSDRPVDPKDAKGLDERSLAAVLGDAPMRRCVQGWAALRSLLQKLELLVAGAIEERESDDPVAVALSAHERPNPVESLYDVEHPVEVRRYLLRFLRLLAATRVIARAEERGERLAPWLALALAEAFATTAIEAEEGLSGDMQGLSRALAAYESAKEEAEAVDAAVADWRRQAADSGASVYFPFASDDGEDR